MSAIAGTFRAVRRMLALCAFICVSVSAAYADAVADFYRDKTITIVIGHPVGGSYDLYARLIARHVGKYIPGNPSVIIQNMPGASALIATNFVVNNPTQDGTLIAAIGSNGPFQPMLESGAVKFDPVNTNWLPSPASMVALLVVWHTAPVEKFEDMKHKELQIATLSPVSIPSFYAAIFNDLFKTKMKLILGYGGMGNAYLAMERGEIDGFPSTPWDSVKRIYSNLLAQKRSSSCCNMVARHRPNCRTCPSRAISRPRLKTVNCLIFPLDP